MANWTIGTILLFASIIPESIAAYISFKGFKDAGYLHYLFMGFTWLFMMISNLFLAIAYLELNRLIYKIGIFFTIFITLSIVFLVDAISRGKIDPLKLVLVTSISSAQTIFLFDEDSVIFNTSKLGEVSPALHGRALITGSMLFVISGFLWFYFMLRIHLNAPDQIKKYSKINLMGSSIAGPGAAILFATGFVWILPGSDYLFIGIGALLTAYAFYRQPKLGYVLPFNVYRLNVIDSVSGISVFHHNWDDSGLADSMLFSSTLSSISTILNESVGRGSVREIKFDNGVLLVNKFRNSQFLATLLASKSNNLLMEALNHFSSSFHSNLDLDKIEVHNISKFERAEDIIDEAFPFVVSYN